MSLKIDAAVAFRKCVPATSFKAVTYESFAKIKAFDPSFEDTRKDTTPEILYQYSHEIIYRNISSFNIHAIIKISYIICDLLSLLTSVSPSTCNQIYLLATNDVNRLLRRLHFINALILINQSFYFVNKFIYFP